MFVNKLSNTIKVPYNMVKGSVIQRQAQANQMTDNLYKLFEKDIKDNYALFQFSDIIKKIFEIIPKNLSVFIKPNRNAKYGAYTENLYNHGRKAVGVAIYLPEISKSVRTAHLPLLMHEFQHVTDQICHPKYASRAQSLNRKKLLNKKYERLYDKYFYCIEDCRTEKAKNETLENVKIRTMNFLKKHSIREQLDFIQDTRYTLESEIAAYKKENEFAQKLKDNNLQFFKESLINVPERSLFAEKIQILKEIGFELIKNERKAHAQRLNATVSN